MLQVKDIDLYYGASQALRGVSIEAAKGAVTCILQTTADARFRMFGRNC